MAYCNKCQAPFSYDISPDFICPECQHQNNPNQHLHLQQQAQHQHQHHQQQQQQQHQHLPRLSRTNHHHRQQSEPAHLSQLSHPHHPVPGLRHQIQPPLVLARHNIGHNNISHAHNRSASANLTPGMATCVPPHSSGHLNGSRIYSSNATNHLWSDNEDTSKSQAKLGDSAFLPYIPEPSMAEMSCDNVSNNVRLGDALPAPGYYLHAPAKLESSNSSSGDDRVDLLPLCQLVFNLISLIIYFCENTFGVIALIALYYHTAHKTLAVTGAVVVLTSHLACQLVSFRWTYRNKLAECRQRKEARNELDDEVGRDNRYYGLSRNWLSESSTELHFKFLLAMLFELVCHVFFAGILTRYLRLVTPVADVPSIKRQTRELSALRLVHAFGQSVWLLIIQLYVVACQLQTSGGQANSPSLLSAGLSLLAICWALASFVKLSRTRPAAINWFALASQLLWRLGTISSRVLALTVYALCYGHWMLVVLALHWFVMLLWLVKPTVLIRHEEDVSGARRLSLATLVAWIYCFCYVNLDEHNPKSKVTLYYIIMFVENNMLLTVSLIFSSQTSWFKNLSMVVIYLGFIFGMIFMFLYYKFFHPNILEDGFSCSQESFGSIAEQLSAAGKKIAGIKTTGRYKSEDNIVPTHRYSNTLGVGLAQNSRPDTSRTLETQYLGSNHQSQPGLFTCKTTSEHKHHKLHSSHSRRMNDF